MPHKTRDDYRSEESGLEPIAICGMACRLPGGVDSASSLWDMLVEKRTGQTPKVPQSRFNVDAHYHENPDRPGSLNVLGGYFLDGQPHDFDPSAFNMTPIEAQWLDPQQRRMLEVTYECLESAGIPLDKISGSCTAVFVGSFTADYQQMSIREPDFRHNYAATGVDPGIISNRIGNVFNLNGPSFTINTACSSSVYAIHNACHALRARDCDSAIAGGVNLILTVDQHMNTAKLGILSPRSTCNTYDAAADGYGRAEGAGALFLKRLSDAIRDGDPVRGVIRSSAVNTNGKVEGMGITHPSIKGQERVVRMAYSKANLDPNRTLVAELHGTGTPVGDPIETHATANAMNDTRSPSKPLLLGALKPNIGHSEAASGIFAVRKAAMMTEAAVIPGVALFKNINPKILEHEWNVKVNVDTIPWPEIHGPRRASVSSFGYRGTNGHIIVESVESLYPWYQHGKRKAERLPESVSSRPFLICFSAHDKPTLTRNIKAHAEIASRYHLSDLSYTLNMRRTRYPTRAFAIAREGSEVDALLPANLQLGTTRPGTFDTGFLFTGQGAQWAGMGQQALRDFPSMLQTIRRLDGILARLSPPPSLILVDFLLQDPSVASRYINNAEIAQPLCTAIQIALVDLFAEWDIGPSVSIGHSSGEIGAAYASGLLSAPEAIVVAYCRGMAVKESAPFGSMLAVGLGAEEVRQHLSGFEDRIFIACENSPNSVTLSGLSEAISEAKARFDTEPIFARELKTGRAYHSPQMTSVSIVYETKLKEALMTLSGENFTWRRPRTGMISSVTGEVLEVNHLPCEYWSANLRQRVLFSTAITVLGTSEAFSSCKSLVEIGPHSALSGPFKQIKKAHNLEQLTYIPSLAREKNDTNQLLSVAGSLFLVNYPVDLDTVNSEILGFGTLAARKQRSRHLLVDLPPYQWNYSKQYWAEPRPSVEQRRITHARHDLLGRMVTGLSNTSRVWRNVLRQRDVTWLVDHKLGGTVIFPAAGHMSLAIEALRQVLENSSGLLRFESVTLRDVDIKTALVVPDTDVGVEILVRFERLSPTPPGGRDWYSFHVESLVESEWTLHCQGRISAGHKHGPSQISPVEIKDLTQKVHGKRWYETFDRVGFNYGPNFQQVKTVQTNRKIHHAAGDVSILQESAVMKGESRYMIHPSSVDACLQLIIISIHRGRHKDVPYGVVPTRIEEATLTMPDNEDIAIGSAVAWTDEISGRYFGTHTQLFGQSGKMLLDIKNLRCVAYEAAIPPGTSEKRSATPFSAVNWEPESDQQSILNQVVPMKVNVLTVKHADSKDLINALQKHLPNTSGSALEDFLPDKRKSLVINDSDGTLFNSLDATAFEALRRALCAGLPTLWLTKGVRQGSNISAGIADGFLRVIRSERAAAKIALLDYDESEDLAHVSQIIVQKLLSLVGNQLKDTEFWLRQGILYISRILPQASLNSALAPSSDHFESAQLPQGAKLSGQAIDHQLIFQQSAMSSTALPPEHVEIQVLASQLNNDSECPILVYGTVIRAGPLVDSSIMGHAVIAITTESLTTMVSTAVYTVVGRNLDKLKLLADLSHALHATNIESSTAICTNDRVLLLPGPEPVTNALIKLASVRRWNLMVVCPRFVDRPDFVTKFGIEEDKVQIVVDTEVSTTRPEGQADVIVSHDFSSLSQEAWRSIKPTGRFVLYNSPLASAPEMLPFVRGASFIPTSWKASLNKGNAFATRLLESSLQLLQANGTTFGGKGYNIIDVQDIQNLQEAHHLQNPIVQYNYGQSIVKVKPQRKALKLSPDATFLLVGCLGGLGRSLTKFMLDHGCRHFTFLSRSGTDKPEAAHIVRSLQEEGASVEVFRTDASDALEVKRIVSMIHTDRPIRGVVHAAMVLKDGLFEKMDYDSFMTAVIPKVNGALSLHDALQDINLDFLVMTSSISAVLGNPGQANYSAANSFLDALAFHRNVNGLAATSLALPMVLDVGVVAESDILETQLTRKGLYGIDEYEMLRGFEVAMSQPTPQVGHHTQHHNSQIIMGLEATELAKAVAKIDTANAYWYEDPRLTYIRTELDMITAESGSTVQTGTVAQDIKTAMSQSRDAAIAVVAQHVAKRVSSILMIPVEDFDLDGPSIASYGLDSMIGAEMRTWLYKEFGLDFPFQKLLAPTLSFVALAGVVLETLDGRD
ncbi:putative polyketide synthase [Pleomassaria siparia CBS 279.74]|uniref:Putative polyketide synthase n=1 Tax=Pleomassaria siparia CBS 279.74 TaxID=1314801 RepID=A0A6G1KDQ7_9PLEO|nr:putative polyketide synthase [Pleomassaria siparia CBS 279.74]